MSDKNDEYWTDKKVRKLVDRITIITVIAMFVAYGIGFWTARLFCEG